MILEYFASYVLGLLATMVALVLVALWAILHYWIWQEIFEDVFLGYGGKRWQRHLCFAILILVLDILPWSVGLWLMPPWGS